MSPAMALDSRDGVVNRPTTVPHGSSWFMVVGWAKQENKPGPAYVKNEFLETLPLLESI